MAKKISPLERAVNSLNVDDIYICGSSAELLNEFEPRYEAQWGEVEHAHMHLVSKSQIIQLENPEAQYDSKLRIFIEFGAKGARSVDEEEAIDLFEIRACFVAEYWITNKDLLEDEEAISEFAFKNCSFQVWPYWREFAAATSTRMNIQKIVMPVMMRPSNESDNPASTEKGQKP
jgi:hypothetical protein